MCFRTYRTHGKATQVNALHGIELHRKANRFGHFLSGLTDVFSHQPNGNVKQRSARHRIAEQSRANRIESVAGFLPMGFLIKLMAGHGNALQLRAWQGNAKHIG